MCDAHGTERRREVTERGELEKKMWHWEWGQDVRMCGVQGQMFSLKKMIAFAM